MLVCSHPRWVLFIPGSNKGSCCWNQVAQLSLEKFLSSCLSFSNTVLSIASLISMLGNEVRFTCGRKKSKTINMA